MKGRKSGSFKMGRKNEREQRIRKRELEVG